MADTELKQDDIQRMAGAMFGDQKLEKEPQDVEDIQPEEEGQQPEVQPEPADEPAEVRTELQDEDELPQQRESDQSEEEPVEETADEKSVEDILAELSTEYGISEEPAKEEEQEEEGKSSLNSESTADINALIAEKTGGKFKSLDEMVASLSEQKPQTGFASERIQKLNELEAQGVDISKVLKFESLKVDELNTEDISDAFTLIKEKMKIDDPDATDQDINYLLREYAYDEDMDEDEINYKKSLIRRTARKAKKDLLDTKMKLELPSGNNKQIEAQQKQQEELYKQWTDTVSQATSKYSNETFSLGESNEFVFSVDDKVRQDVANSITNPTNFWNRYTNQDGTTKMDELLKDMTLVHNRETILKSAYNQGMANGARDIVKKLTNAKPKGHSKPTNRAKKNFSIEQQILNQLKG